MNVHGYEVPQSVFDALFSRLRKGSAPAYVLVGVAHQAGAPDKGEHYYTCHRIVDRWLQRERRAGRIEFKKREWHVVGKEGSNK